MTRQWRDLDIFLPSTLAPDEVKDELRTRVIATADEAGEFVRRIRIGSSERHSDDWVRWRASYLTGPPGLRKLRTFG